MDNNQSIPDISVIIAAYNVQAYIERAISSALEQKGVSVEIIVVDDHSTDDTVAAASAIIDPRVKILSRATNGGPGIARNEGFSAASGAWLAVLDGDDVFAPGRLMRCLQRAREMKADIVVDNIDIYREVDGATYPMFPAEKFGRRGSLDLVSFIRGNLFLFGGRTLGYLKPVFSAALLRQYALAYDPDILIGEDYMLMADALACGARCAVEKTSGYRYTVRTGSISHRLSVADIERIQAGDRAFLSRHDLDSAARNAQKWREFSLREVYFFTKLVDALKQKRMMDALRVAVRRPTAVLHLWEAAYVRIKRLFGGEAMR